MLTMCWAAKGGSGTTVFAAAKALASPIPTLLVDLAGDAMAVLGLPEPDGPGVHDWLRSDAPAERLVRLEHRATEHLSVLAAGEPGDPDAAGRWFELCAHLRADGRNVVVDAGSGRPPTALLAAADENLLVTRACYVALRRAVALGITPTGVVLVEEPGRSLRAADIEASIGAPVVSTALLDPAIARAVDAGLLVSRLPGAWRRRLRAAA
jgi:hypothetical protein